VVERPLCIAKSAEGPGFDHQHVQFGLIFGFSALSFALLQNITSLLLALVIGVLSRVDGNT
jgi:hypothetical protein